MFYHIRHLTRFTYSAPITESVTEVRMQPRESVGQRCMNFRLTVRPTSHISTYLDFLENRVHHFNIPGAHREVAIVAEADVQIIPQPLPAASLEPADWQRINAILIDGDLWEWLAPTASTSDTACLAELARELGVERRGDPLSLLQELNTALYQTFAYDAESTRVDSPIDEAITKRRGVCQDFTHIMLALVRNYLQMPCRYVSGYLYHRRADRSSASATHAWLEVMLPDLGWVGFDPTNNILAGERHIQVALGRDYHDVPPTRGVFKGLAQSELSVAVRIRRAEDPPEEESDELHTPVYVTTQQELQEQYNQTLLAMIQMQQQQQ